MGIRVQRCAGHRGEEEPVALCLDERRLELAGVVDHRRATNPGSFNVRGADGSPILLRHDALIDPAVAGTAAGRAGKTLH